MVEEVEYARSCAMCRKAARLVCCLCRIQTCWPCYGVVHQQTGSVAAAAAAAHRARLLETYHRRGATSPPTVPLHEREEEGELNNE